MLTFRIHPLAAGSPDMADFETFRQSVLTGLEHPISIRMVENGSVAEIIDGRHRFRVLDEAGEPLLVGGRPNPAFFKIEDDVDDDQKLLTLYRKLNEDRRHHLSRDQQVAEDKRLVKYGKSIKDVAAQRGVSDSTVYRQTEGVRRERKQERDEKIMAGKEAGKTVRQVAEETGVSVGTVSAVFKNSQNAKNRTEAKPKPKKEPKVATRKQADKRGRIGQTDIVAEIVTDDILLAFEQLCNDAGKSRQVMINEMMRDRILNPPLPKLTREQRTEFDRVTREYKRSLWAEYQLDVSAKARQIADTLILPNEAKRLADADKLLKQRKGVFKPDDYKKIIACLHPDSSPSQKQKQEAFALVTEQKLLLLTEKDDPRTSKSEPLPSLAEMLARRKGRTMNTSTGATAPARVTP